MRSILVSLCLAVFGCGPSIDGKWKGSWTASTPYGLQTGQLSLLVDGEEATGSGVNAQIGESYTIVGTVRPAPAKSTWDADMTYTYPQATYTAVGTMKLVSSHATGEFEMKAGGKAFGTSTVDLKREP